MPIPLIPPRGKPCAAPSRCWLAISFSMALIGGCATTSDGSRTDDTVAFALQATQRNAGKTGGALMARQGDKTVIRLTVTAVPPWVVRPVQLYTFVYAGTCVDHQETPAYALNEIVQADLLGNAGPFGPFILEKTLPAPIDTLRAEAHAIVVRTSPADGNVDIYCGDMR